MDDSDIIKNLKYRLKVLEEENILLSERAQETNLMRSINESINTQNNLETLIDEILEKVSILLDIPFCTYCDLNNGKVTQEIAYSSFFKKDNLDNKIYISERLMKSAMENNIYVAQSPWNSDDFNMQFSEEKFIPKEFAIIPVLLKHSDNKIFIFADDQNSGKLTSNQSVLLNIVNLIGYKINEIHLLLAMQEEIEYRKKLEEELRELSNIDSLTGLLNRRFFDTFAINLINQTERFNETFSLLLIDIDNFKYINDLFGHPEGDSVLIKVSNLFRENTRKSDIVARYGGEEFMILCPHHDLATGQILAEKLRLIVEKTKLSEHTQVTISVGVAAFKSHSTLAELYSGCDRALYEAKNSGKNKVILCS